MGKTLILKSYLATALVALAVVGVSTIVFADSSATSVTVGNAAPSVTSVNIQGSSITLTENATTGIIISATITDTNGCGDVVTSGTTVGTLFREGVSSTCSADDRNCYVSITMVASTSDACSGGADTTADMFATASVWFFADATDASSSYSGQTWFLSVKATDDSDASSTATDTTPSELNTLVALNVSSTIAYGQVSPNANTAAVNQNATTTNTGNADRIDLEISGTALSSGANNIAADQQKYGSTTGDYTSVLTYTAHTTAYNRNWNIGKTTTSVVTAASSTFWGIAVPSGQATGTYTGTNTFTAVWSS